MSETEDDPVHILPSDRTVMAAEQFDTLITALEVPEDTQNLPHLFKQERRFIQR